MSALRVPSLAWIWAGERSKTWRALAPISGVNSVSAHMRNRPLAVKVPHEFLASHFIFFGDPCKPAPSGWDAVGLNPQHVSVRKALLHHFQCPSDHVICAGRVSEFWMLIIFGI